MTDPTVRLPVPGEPESPGPIAAAGASGPPPPSGAAPAAPPDPAPGPAPRRRDHGDMPGRLGSIVVGLILLGIGLWFFAEQSLGLAMPDVDWGRFWPLILIGIGAWILLGSRRRGRG